MSPIYIFAHCHSLSLNVAFCCQTKLLTCILNLFVSFIFQMIFMISIQFVRYYYYNLVFSSLFVLFFFTKGNVENNSCVTCVWILNCVLLKAHYFCFPPDLSRYLSKFFFYLQLKKKLKKTQISWKLHWIKLSVIVTASTIFY